MQLQMRKKPEPSSSASTDSTIETKRRKIGHYYLTGNHYTPEEAFKEFDVLKMEEFIDRLLSVHETRGKMVEIAEHEIRALCEKASLIFWEQPMLLELDAPVKICGDIHGQFWDLLEIFKRCGHPPDSNYLFLGDYVDRGHNSIETICLLLAYKIKYENNFFLLRGNHECAYISKFHGFYDECRRRYHNGEEIWKMFRKCFEYMPVAALVQDMIFCVHGGLSPELHDLRQIASIRKPVVIPPEGLLCDLLWADPDKTIQGWGTNEDRQVSYTFGEEIVKRFCVKHHVSLICRAHQVVDDGYEFFANRQLVTIFSAPNYVGHYANAGAVMSVDRKGVCSFAIFQPTGPNPCQSQNKPLFIPKKITQILLMPGPRKNLERTHGDCIDSIVV